jgi:hypothetical protein
MGLEVSPMCDINQSKQSTISQKMECVWKSKCKINIQFKHVLITFVKHHKHDEIINSFSYKYHGLHEL